MSTATHRSLARLPVDLFEGLQKHRACSVVEKEECAATMDGDVRHDLPVTLSAVDLRGRIVAKLGQALILPSQQQRTLIQHHQNQRGKDLSSGPPPLLPQQQQQLPIAGITTVGNLLQRLSPLSLVEVLDPLLTYLECCELYRRICQYTAPKSITALAMLHQTTATPCSVSTAPSGATCAPNIGIPFNTSRSIASPQPPTLQRHWPTGWTTLDTALRGGFRVGTLTEVVGAAGTGKTQLSMQLAVHTILRHNQSHSASHDPYHNWSIGGGGGGCIFIDTEQKISLSRLNEIAAATIMATSATTGTTAAASISSEMSDGRNAGSHTLNLLDVMENIHVHTPRSTLDLQLVLKSLEEVILERNAKASERNRSNPNNTQRPGPRCLPIRLLVIDSIAAPLRRGSESTTNNYSAASQAATAVQIAQALKRLADQFQLVVCVVNQVGSVYTVPPVPNDLSQLHSIDSQVLPHQHPPTTTTTMEGGTTGSMTSTMTTRAALGTAWHHCVSTRIELHCGPPPQQLPRGARRYALIVKSNLVRNSIAPMPFQIATHGISDDATDKP